MATKRDEIHSFMESKPSGLAIEFRDGSTILATSDTPGRLTTRYVIPPERPTIRRLSEGDARLLCWQFGRSNLPPPHFNGIASFDADGAIKAGKAPPSGRVTMTIAALAKKTRTARAKKSSKRKK